MNYIHTGEKKSIMGVNYAKLVAQVTETLKAKS